MKSYTIRISERHQKYLKDKATRVSKKMGFIITSRAVLEAIIENNMSKDVNVKKSDK